MNTNRRKFISTTVTGSLAAAALPLSYCWAEATSNGSIIDVKSRYAKLDEILKKPILKKELFTTPVIIETLELLRFENSFLCRIQSKDGAEGISVGHNELSTLFPIFLKKL
ncbi:MAG: hypothetical protein WCL37_08110, partial [Chrysiogenales bacterium]